MKIPDRVRGVITGAGSGLGRALALRLARRNARLVLSDVNLDAVNETARLVTEAGGTAEAMRCDVAELSQVEETATAAERLWGGTDLVVNNAGVAVAGLVGDVPMKDWHWIMNINLWGVIHGCHVFVPRLKAQRQGWILNVASSAGIVSAPEMGPYNVSKAGVISLSETLYTELAPEGISVAALCPTFFHTNLMSSFRSPDERQRNLATKMFERSNVSAEDVADCALKGLERGKLIIIPQTDGRIAHLLKRLSPRGYFSLMRRQQSMDLLSRLLDKKAS